jgi:uncharacterized repeat protein (TIGR01451 family)
MYFSINPQCGFRISLCWFCSILMLLIPHTVRAIGTPAGTLISNKAILSYVMASVPSFTTSNTASFRVDEVIQPVLTWQNGTPVAVNSPGSNDVLTFLLTNSGNGAESFGLTRTNGPAPLASDNYVPLNGSIGSIYLENNLLAGFQATGPNADTLYVPGLNPPTLAPDASLVIYVVSDTPTVAINTRGDVLLTGTALIAGAAGALQGAALPGLGQGGVNAVIGSSHAQANATGSYIASGVCFTLSKIVLKVLDPQGGIVLMPGSVMTYQIMASLSGTGTATNLMITDPLPANATYVPESIVVNGIEKTDAADTDNAQYLSTTQTVSVSPGNMVSPANIVITFRAVIN